MKINVDFIYPIGSVYITTQPTNPSVLFGGIWQQTCKSRCIMGAGANIVNTDNTLGTYAANTNNFSAEARIGEATHQLIIAEMPSHSHTLQKNVPYGIPYNNTSGAGSGSGGTMYGESYTPFSILNSGGDGAHNNIPPVEVYYIWKRVA